MTLILGFVPKRLQNKEYMHGVVIALRMVRGNVNSRKAVVEILFKVSEKAKPNFHKVEHKCAICANYQRKKKKKEERLRCANVRHRNSQTY